MSFNELPSTYCSLTLAYIKHCDHFSQQKTHTLHFKSRTCVKVGHLVCVSSFIWVRL